MLCFFCNTIHVGISDYQPPFANLVFNESTNSYRISVSIVDDTVPENDEYFFLSLVSNEQNVTISPDSALVVILYSELAIPPECVTSNVRLGNNMTGTEGRVEVCLDGEWSTVCDNQWDYRDAVVACIQLGLPSYGMRDKIDIMQLYITFY